MPPNVTLTSGGQRQHLEPPATAYEYYYSDDYPDNGGEQFMWLCEENATSTYDWTPVTSWSSLVTVLLCSLGAVGNLLSLSVLSSRVFLRKLGMLEFNASITMCALALSDLCFCVCVVPYPLTRGYSYYAPSTAGGAALLYYRYYGHALVNLFLMTGTYLTVVLAVERCIVLYYPLRAKRILARRATLAAIVLLTAFCVLGTLPYFLNMTVAECQQEPAGAVLYEMLPVWPHTSLRARLVTLYMTWLWPVLAVFLPLAVLLVCNVKLITGMRHVRALRRRVCPPQQSLRFGRGHRITAILVVIISASILLLTPAEVIKLINPYEMWGDRGYMIADVVNFLQNLNFSFNFLLYCVLDKSFCAALLCRKKQRHWQLCRRRTTGDLRDLRCAFPICRRESSDSSKNVIPLTATRVNMITTSGGKKSSSSNQSWRSMQLTSILRRDKDRPVHV